MPPPLKDAPGDERAEFDAYAADYQGGVEHPLKRFLGGSLKNFLEVKVQWLLKDLARHPVRSAARPEDLKLLDFGCGTGEFLQLLRSHGFPGHLEGCDASEGMLGEAVRRWREGERPLFHVAGLKHALPFADDSYDVIVACCVFHHIGVSRRQEICRELLRIIKPNGRLVIFEHNPHNPLTRFMVRRTPIDRHAALVTPSDMRHAVVSVGLTHARSASLLFFPPRLTWLRNTEEWLAAIPLGGQYACVSEKPSRGTSFAN